MDNLDRRYDDAVLYARRQGATEPEAHSFARWTKEQPSENLVALLWREYNGVSA